MESDEAIRRILATVAITFPIIPAVHAQKKDKAVNN
jgi:hypothetical protein